MGFGGISLWQLLIVLAIVITIFGGTRLRSLGTDLGAAVRHFRAGLGTYSGADGASTTPANRVTGTADGDRRP